MGGEGDPRLDLLVELADLTEALADLGGHPPVPYTIAVHMDLADLTAAVAAARRRLIRLAELDAEQQRHPSNRHRRNHEQ